LLVVLKIAVVCGSNGKRMSTAGSMPTFSADAERARDRDELMRPERASAGA
jgi:hypothetical protein